MQEGGVVGREGILLVLGKVNGSVMGSADEHQADACQNQFLYCAKLSLTRNSL